MKGYFKGITKFPVRFMPITICLMILFACLSLYTAIYNGAEMERNISIMDREKVDLQWKLVESAIQDSHAISKLEAKALSLEVERELRLNYGDMRELKNDMDNDIYSDSFNELLKGVLHESDHTKGSVLTLVGNKDKLITLFANNDDHLFRDLHSAKAVPWEEVAYFTENPDLTLKAIDAIIRRYPDIIFTQSQLVGNEVITDMNMDQLKGIYEEEGLQGLRGVTLLAAAYITEDGDIFGVEDSTRLQSNSNHKIILVNSVNVSDVIDENQLLVEFMQRTITSVKDVTETHGIRSIYQSVLWCAFSFLISMYLIFVYNNEERRGILGVRTENESKGGKKDSMRGD